MIVTAWARCFRSGLALVCGLGAAAAYTLWQLVVEQKFFLHTVFVGRISGSAAQRLPLGYWNVVRLKLTMGWQQLRGEPEALKDYQFKVYKTIRERLQARGVRPGTVTAVQEYQAGDVDPRTFYREHVKTGVPAVIRGFHNGDVSRFRFEALAEQFPQVVAQAVDTAEEKIVSVRLRELVRDRGLRYEPLQALLDQDHELRSFFDADRAGTYFPVLGLPSRPMASFLILGLGKGLAAEFHCEESANWYMAVSGSKRWTLVEAEHTWLMYAAARGDGMRRFSEFKAGPDGTPQDSERFALFDYAPRLEVDLHPGDVLVFPAWMWHKTINLDDEGLGMTLRFAPLARMSNRYFRALQMISPDFWRSIVQVVGGKIRGDTSGLEEAGGFNEQELALR
ncbi:MAG TPA: cupin-like domain-containing protein [Acidimicrobiales bacterium]